MEEKEKQTQENEVIQALTEEYEKKIAELTKEKEEIQASVDSKLKEQEEKHIAQLRAILSGRKTEQDPPIPEEKTLEETMLEDLRKKYRI